MTDKTLALGTIVKNTGRMFHIIPAFMDALATVNPERANRLREVYGTCLDALAKEDESHPDTMHLYEKLYETLAHYVPDGYEFGAHPGNMSDIGVWEIDSEPDEFGAQIDGALNADRGDGSAE